MTRLSASAASAPPACRTVGAPAAKASGASTIIIARRAVASLFRKEADRLQPLASFDADGRLTYSSDVSLKGRPSGEGQPPGGLFTASVRLLGPRLAIASGGAF